MIGHQYDIVHPFSDAGMLAEELPNARLLQANSIVELRVAPRQADRTRSPASSTNVGARGPRARARQAS